MTTLLRQPTFARFFAGRLTSLAGSSMAPVALAFAVLDTANGAADLGVVLAASLLPRLLLLVVGGATADRFSRRTVLVAANLGSALTQGAVAGILLAGGYWLPLIAGLEFLNGALAAFTTPALRGIVPDLVDADQLQRANALLGAAGHATKILGPTAAGLLVAVAGGGSAIAIDAASYALAAILLVRLPRSAPRRPQRGQLLTDIRVGWSYFRSVGWLWPVSLAFLVVNLVQTGPWQILGPQVVSRHGGPAAWGLLLSARAVGLLATSVVMLRLTVRHPVRVTVLAGALAAAPLLGLGWGVPTGWLIVLAVAGGVGSSAAGISWETALQQHTPRDKLSRVASLDDLLSYAAIPLGQLATAPLAGALGAGTVCLLSGLIWLTAMTVPLLNRSVRGLERVDPAIVR